MKKFLWMLLVLVVGVVLLTRSWEEVNKEIDKPSEGGAVPDEVTTPLAPTDALPSAGSENKQNSVTEKKIKLKGVQQSSNAKAPSVSVTKNKKVTAASSLGVEALDSEVKPKGIAAGDAAVAEKTAENTVNPTPPVKSVDLNVDTQSEVEVTDSKQQGSADYDVSKPVYESLKEKDSFPLTHPEELLQSEARPLDLDIVAKVQASKSDPGYVKFVDEVLPKLNPKLNKHFDKRKEIIDNSLEAELDDLRLDTDANVRIYFVKEGTVFQNSLGIGLEDEDKLIFPNASSAVSYYKDSTTRVEQTNEDSPMLPGDYVDLGLMKKDSLLDLFIIKDGARDENGAIYGLDKEKNPDKSNHVRIHEVINENTLIVGFEDLPGGGDKDYNDLVIAVEILPVNKE